MNTPENKKTQPYYCLTPIPPEIIITMNHHHLKECKIHLRSNNKTLPDTYPTLEIKITTIPQTL